MIIKKGKTSNHCNVKGEPKVLTWFELFSPILPLLLTNYLSVFDHFVGLVLKKLVSAIFYQIFIFSPNDSPSKTMKSAFYFI